MWCGPSRLGVWLARLMRRPDLEPVQERKPLSLWIILAIYCPFVLVTLLLVLVMLLPAGTAGWERMLRILLWLSPVPIYLVAAYIGAIVVWPALRAGRPWRAGGLALLILGVVLALTVNWPEPVASARMVLMPLAAMIVFGWAGWTELTRWPVSVIRRVATWGAFFVSGALTFLPLSSFRHGAPMIVSVLYLFPPVAAGLLGLILIRPQPAPKDAFRVGATGFFSGMWLGILVVTGAVGGLFAHPTDYPVREIRVVPVGELTPHDAEVLREVIQQEFPAIKVTVESGIAFPARAYHRERDQYNAESVLSALERRAPDRSIRVVGATDANIFTWGTNFVFTAGRPHGRAICISLYYLTARDEALTRLRYRKVIMRGLGLTFGFETARDRSCAMAYSNSLEELDQKGTRWCGSEAEMIQKIEGLK